MAIGGGCAGSGAAGYSASAVLAKPCEPFELVGTLRQLLGEGHSGMP